MKVTDFLETEIRGCGLKLQGLAHLFLACKPDGSRDTDNDASYGIGLMLEEIAKDSDRLSNIAGQATFLPKDFELDVTFTKPDPIGQAEAQIEAARAQKKAASA